MKELLLQKSKRLFLSFLEIFQSLIKLIRIRNIANSKILELYYLLLFNIKNKGLIIKRI